VNIRAFAPVPNPMTRMPFGAASVVCVDELVAHF